VTSTLHVYRSLPNSALQKLSTMLSRVPGCLQAAHVFSSGNTTNSNGYLHTNTLHTPAVQLGPDRVCCLVDYSCASWNLSAGGSRYWTRLPS